MLKVIEGILAVFGVVLPMFLVVAFVASFFEGTNSTGQSFWTGMAVLAWVSGFALSEYYQKQQIR